MSECDRISDLPDNVLCYILSFLPTNVSVATSVLSKRWKHLWRSVPAFHFTCRCGHFPGGISKNIYHDKFVDSMNAFLSLRDPLQSFRRFHLDLVLNGTTCHHENTSKLFTDTGVPHRLEHLDLSFCTLSLQSAVLNCKTLVMLHLRYTVFKHFSSVDLPSLKIMSLWNVSFTDHNSLADLLSGCPNLEEIDVRDGSYIKSYATEAKFKKLYKLVRATMNKYLIPLEVVSNVQFLCIIWMDMEDEILEDLIPQFHNLTSIELCSWGNNRSWPEVLRMLKHCPKLQHLVVDQRDDDDEFEDEHVNGEYPLCVPGCISSHLKTCRINGYCEDEKEFEFVRYIMENARVLQKMIIYVHHTINSYGTVEQKRKRRKMRKKLRLCSKLSSICKLLVTEYPF